ncbi:MAG: low molecular weight protein-tyrosine-phosphatase [Corynebacterium sp.]|nr:low molecular weight protein-tyrosine-phosphatase [Corynebacterium sp.]
MAEALFAAYLANEHPEADIEVTSAGIGGWHQGQHADHRTREELAAAGIDGSYLRASQVTDYDLTADVLVAMDHTHVRDLELLGAESERIHLMRDFDPASEPGSVVDDPYYGGPHGFTVTRMQITAGLDGLYDYVVSLSAD